jgi:DNA gyrase subunit A
MLALVDGVPRTLSLDGFISNWVTHQIEVIVRRTQFRLRKAEERAHILRAYLKALDALDEVIALIRRSATVEEARDGLMALLEIDKLQAHAPSWLCNCVSWRLSNVKKSLMRQPN